MNLVWIYIYVCVHDNISLYLAIFLNLHFFFWWAAIYPNVFHVVFGHVVSILECSGGIQVVDTQNPGRRWQTKTKWFSMLTYIPRDKRRQILWPNYIWIMHKSVSLMLSKDFPLPKIEGLLYLFFLIYLIYFTDILNVSYSSKISFDFCKYLTWIPS